MKNWIRTALVVAATSGILVTAATVAAAGTKWA
jgi:hypothetical protein